jgi:hypothetical protein
VTGRHELAPAPKQPRRLVPSSPFFRQAPRVSDDADCAQIAISGQLRPKLEGNDGRSCARGAALVGSVENPFDQVRSVTLDTPGRIRPIWGRVRIDAGTLARSRSSTNPPCLAEVNPTRGPSGRSSPSALADRGDPETHDTSQDPHGIGHDDSVEDGWAIIRRCLRCDWHADD